jgi:type I restriction enzyme S subunit
VINLQGKTTELPNTWEALPMEDSVYKVPLTHKKIKQQDYQQKGKLPVIDQGQQFIGGYTDNEQLRIHSDSPLIVFGDHTKVIKYVDFDFAGGADGIKVIRPFEAFYPKLFYYFLHSISLPDKGYARHFQFLEKSLIPLPPLNEQKRIVAKIEELFTRLDAGVEALEKVKKELKRYRQAVLKYAFEGKLTEQWRKENKERIEPASKLLERIAKEREKTAKGKQKKLPPLDKSNLLELPEGWGWASMRMIGDLVSGQHILKKDYNFNFVGMPYLTGPEDFGLKHPTVSRWTKKPKAIARAGDVLVTVKGAGVGKTNICNLVEMAISRQLMAIRADLLNENYIYFFLQFSFQSFQRLGAGSTIPGIDRETILNIQLPLASHLEQMRIVEEIERHFSIADEAEQVVDRALKQSQRLRQSILKKAFEGKLVHQDPNDEPAEKLLERIKAERAKLQAEKREKKEGVK